MNETNIAGCILGTAVGDALGLPYERLSRQRAPRMLGPPDRHRFLFGRGMISDDTEHTCMVAQSLIACGGNVDTFTIDLGKRLSWWFASLPAGLGKATLRSCLKLWLGVSPTKSGVFSAGNGPAMRSAIIGAFFDNIETMVKFTRASARITHSDPKAEYGAIAIAPATHMGCRSHQNNVAAYLEQLTEILGSDGGELVDLVRAVVESVTAGQSTIDFLSSNPLSNAMKKGVSGYTYHTVPVVIHAWLSHPDDYPAAVESVIQCGGDADTTAAIVGGIVGAKTGPDGIPGKWLNNICEWPRSVTWMQRLSKQLAEQLAMSRDGRIADRPITTPFIANLIRNMVFLFVVLFHGFRRLLPPY